MSVHEQKKKLRALLRQKLKTQQPQEDLRLQLRKWLSRQQGRWAGFWPLPGEPDLRSLWTEFAELTWVFPRIDSEKLCFHEIKGTWVPGPYGLTEPSLDNPIIEPDLIQGVLIPGLGFDREGRRLGRGRGYYDRWLASFRGIRVGVCFESQWVEQIPAEEHDQKMDLIVTERGVWDPSLN